MAMTPALAVGIQALGYYLPPRTETVETLHASGRTTTRPEQLRGLGYAQVHVAGSMTTVEMARSAIADLQRRSDVDLGRVSLILYGGALATSSVIEVSAEQHAELERNPLPLFRFPGTRLQAELGLPHAAVIGVSQLACNAFHGCLRIARALLVAEPGLDSILCVAADKFPEHANREVVFDIMSDGACAAIVRRDEPRGRILGTSQITRGTYWDGESRHDALVAAYFPLARQAVYEAVASAGLSIGDIHCFVPHNFSVRSWEILSRILEIDHAKVFLDNVARIGHVVASDNVINYVDAVSRGRIRPGDKVALFVTGFGAHFSCTIVEA